MSTLSKFVHFFQTKENRSFVILMLLLAALPVSLVAIKTQQIFRNQAAAPKSSPQGAPVNPIPSVFGYHALIGDGVANTIIQLYGGPCLGDPLRPCESERLQVDGPMTLEAWINFSQIGSSSPQVSSKTVAKFDYPGGSLYRLDIKKLTNGGEINWHKEDWGTKSEFNQTASQTFDANTWYHVAGVYDGTKTKIFVNGIQKTGSGVMAPITRAIPPTIPSDALKVAISATTSGYDLRLEDLRISKIARDVAGDWTRGIYNAPLKPVSISEPRDSNTVGLWHFEQLGPYTDFSGRQNQLTGRGNIKFEPHLEAVARPTPWKVEYYNNPRFIGSKLIPFKDPKITENIIYKGNDGKEIDGIWARFGSSSPTAGIVKDRFSVVWTKNVNFKAGTYKFNAFVDDFATIKVNNVATPVVDKGSRSEYGNKTFNYTFPADGTYPIVVQYRDERGSARMDLTWTKLP